MAMLMRVANIISPSIVSNVAAAKPKFNIPPNSTRCNAKGRSAAVI